MSLQYPDKVNEVCQLQPLMNMKYPSLSEERSQVSSHGARRGTRSAFSASETSTSWRVLFPYVETIGNLCAVVDAVFLR